MAEGPETLATLSRTTGEPVKGRFVVTAVSGADHGASVILDRTRTGRVLFGQSSVCELRLRDPQVSRRHGALEHTGTALRISDLGSTNGTYVNGVKISIAELSGGETIEIGTTRLTVALEAMDAEGTLPKRSSFGRTLGASVEMRRIYDLCEKLASADIPVIIEGETGTGKEVLAESIHEASSRSNGPFIIFDCTAVPPSLVESELFGHERGAFTGAVTTRKGVFEQAQGGTLLIDEIGDLDLSLQPKLLRALERSEVRRVGGQAWIRVDVRVLAATRRDLDRAVQAGRFRDDLFHRLAIGRIELPPLRDRKGDILPLARHFWRQLGGGEQAIPVALLHQFEDYGWPGNVRELRNAVARYLALGEFEKADAALRLSDREGDSTPATDSIERLLDMNLPFVQARNRILDEFVERYTSRLLATHGGDVGKAVAASGIGRRYFQRLRTGR
jgi:DNA-binding NtrC family response regulator